MKYTTAYFSGLVEAALADLEYPAGTPRLFEPIRYTLEGGGKRLRPSLLLATYAALSHRDAAEVMNQALAVEMFHNFTLLHDDVMDRAELRRGRPTVHVRWNSNAAILSGDAMLTLSTMLLARCDSRQLPALLGLFDTTAMEVYQGQQLDMEFERRNDVTVNEYLEMIRLKTSVLLACACAMGARLAGAPEKVVNAMYAYGEDLGLPSSCATTGWIPTATPLSSARKSAATFSTAKRRGCSFLLSARLPTNSAEYSPRISTMPN